MFPASTHITSLSKPEQLTAAIELLSSKCDFALIIAPESSGILASIIEQVTRSGCPVLNASASLIRKVSNKGAMLQKIKQTPQKVKEMPEKIKQTPQKENVQPEKPQPRYVKVELVNPNQPPKVEITKPLFSGKLLRLSS